MPRGGCVAVEHEAERQMFPRRGGHITGQRLGPTQRARLGPHVPGGHRAPKPLAEGPIHTGHRERCQKRRVLAMPGHELQQRHGGFGRGQVVSRKPRTLVKCHGPRRHARLLQKTRQFPHAGLFGGLPWRRIGHARQFADMRQQQIRLKILGALKQIPHDLAHRGRINRAQLYARTAARHIRTGLRPHHTTRRTGHRNSPTRQRQLQPVGKPFRRPRHRYLDSLARASRRQLPPQVNQVAVAGPIIIQMRRKVRRHGDDLIAEHQTAPWLQQRAGTARAGMRTGLHAHPHQVVVQRQRRDQPRLATAQIIHRPTRTGRRAAKKRGIANHLAIDTTHAGTLNNAHQRLKIGPEIRAQPPLVPARITMAHHHQITPQHSIRRHRTRRIDGGGQPVIAAQAIQRQRRRVQLGVGGRTHQPVGIMFKQGSAGIQRDDFDAPSGCRKPRLRQLRVEQCAQLLDAADAIGRLRQQEVPGAQPQPGDQQSCGVVVHHEMLFCPKSNPGRRAKRSISATGRPNFHRSVRGGKQPPGELEPRR